MTIEIKDNREQWLISLGRKLAVAVEEEKKRPAWHVKPRSRG